MKGRSPRARSELGLLSAHLAAESFCTLGWPHSQCYQTHVVGRKTERLRF